MIDDRLYFSDILECIERIKVYTQEGREAFMASMLVQDGIIRNLEVIGEATKRISDQVRQSYPDVPWKQMAGMRDVLIHDYLRINLKRVWQTVEQDLPILKTTLITLVQELEP